MEGNGGFLIFHSFVFPGNSDVRYDTAILLTAQHTLVNACVGCGVNVIGLGYLISYRVTIVSYGSGGWREGGREGVSKWR